MIDERMENYKNCSASFAIGLSDFSTSEPLLNAETIVASGMDFIEPGLAKVAAMSSEEFENARERIERHQIRVPSVNWFLPPDIKVTGPDADDTRCRLFLNHALARATTLGAQSVVFGSPGSRTLPKGFPADQGRQQMIAFCRMCSEVIRETIGRSGLLSSTLTTPKRTSSTRLRKRSRSFAKLIDPRLDWRRTFIISRWKKNRWT